MTDVLQAAEILTLAEEALDQLSHEQVDEGQTLLPVIVEAWAELVDDAGVERVAGLARERERLLGRLDGHSGADRLALLRIERIEKQIDLAAMRLRNLPATPVDRRRASAQEEIARLTALGMQIEQEPKPFTADVRDRLEKAMMQAYGAGHK